MKRTKKVLLAIMLVCMSCLICVFMLACNSKPKMQYSFETNGGEAIERIEVEEGKEFTLPVPEREGYGFDGWYLNENLSGTSYEKYVASENATFYAKWTKLATLTLELDGGTFAASSYQVKVGENVSAFMQALGVPTKSGLEFGAWFTGNVELTKTAKMPEAGLTLMAKYKVGYTVEIYKQTLDKTGYEKEAEDIKGSAYVGTEFTSTQKFVGFTEAETENTVSTLTLSANASENVYKHYFDRESYTVSFVSNYPDGTNNDRTELSVVYGESVEVVSDFTCEGYCLVGYSTRLGGEVEYAADTIAKALVNAEETVESAPIYPESNMTLYGVWRKGYTDVFGGSDYLYYFVTTENGSTTRSLYLSRGGKFFKAASIRSNMMFEFELPNGTLLEGRLNDNHTFSYLSDSRNSYSATLFRPGVGLVEDTKITFDYYNGITYIDGANQSKGTYTVEIIDNAEYYTATFTEGPLTGRTIVFNRGMTNDGTNAFQVRNDEDIALGTLYRFGVFNGGIGQAQYFEVSFDGYSTATINLGGEPQACTYQFTEDRTQFTLRDGKNELVFVAKLTVRNGVNGYITYNEKYDHTYTFENGDTLVLDGAAEATYTANGTAFEGYFTAKSSLVGTAIVTVAKGNTTYTFLVNEKKRTVTEEDGSTREEIDYLAETRLNGYIEYFYYGGSTPSPSPLIILNDEKEGGASLYVYTEASDFVKVSSGVYEYDEATDTYLYTAENYYNQDQATAAIGNKSVDLCTVKSMVFSLTTVDIKMFGSSISIRVHFWLTMTTQAADAEEPTVEDFKTEYLNKDGSTEIKLYFVAGFAFAAVENNMVRCTVQQQDAYTVLTLPNGSYLIVELNAETHTYELMSSLPYKATAVNPDGTTDRKTTLAFDGKGGAVYTVAGAEGAADTVYAGTVTRTEETLAPDGYYVYVFTATEGDFTFKFIQRSSGNGIFFFAFNEAVNGVYTGPDGEKLELDGYSYVAYYTDVYNNKAGSYYTVVKENMARIALNGYYRFADLDPATKTFKLRGLEYGNYLALDNQSPDGTIYEFDGYGKLTVTRRELNEAGDEYVTVTIDENGAYEFLAEGYIRLTYQENGKDQLVVGKISAVSSGSSVIPVFVTPHDEAVRTYINAEDWSVLILDELGNAVRYTNEGKAERGTYELITNTLFYYINARGSDAAIFRYDVESGFVHPFDLQARGYYTETLGALMFTRYGFVMINGETRLYYSVENNGDVIIYREPAVDEVANANEYGWIEQNMGAFGDTMEWEGVTYIANGGWDLVFDRKEESKNNYPILLKADDTEKKAIESITFTPTGSSTFSVAGVVTIAGERYNCVVNRILHEDGTVEMYLTVGFYRFDITVSYRGDSGNTYEVTDLHYIMDALSDNYCMNYAMVATFYGQSVASQMPNIFGTISIIRDYNEAGEVTRSYLKGEFGEQSGLFDVNGKVIPSIELEEGEYEATDTMNGTVYNIPFTADDGYRYRIHCQIATSRYLGVPGYQMIAFTREQEFTPIEGYKIEVERVVTSDNQNLAPGRIYDVRVYEGETLIPFESAYLVENGVHYIYREKNTETGKIERTVYYLISFTDKALVLGEGVFAIAPFETATLTVVEATTYYTADGTAYVDVGPDGVLWFFSGRSAYRAVSSEYNEETSTYTVVTSLLTQDGKPVVYTVQLVTNDDGTINVVIERVIENA